METRLSNIFKTTNAMKLNNVILETYHLVLQVASKWKTLKRIVYFSKAVEFLGTFDIQIDITLTIFWENLQTILFRKPTEVSLKTRQHSYQQSHPLQNSDLLQKWKVCVFWQVFFQNKNCRHFETFNESNIWIWKIEV